MTASLWGRLAEDRLQRAIEAGEFDGLEGAGKPLLREDESLIPDGWRLAFHLLRNAGLAPLWIELDREVEADLGRLRRSLQQAARWGEDSAAWQDGVRQALMDAERLNRLIEERNLRCPWQLQRPKVRLESETRRALGASRSLGLEWQDG